MMVVAESHVAFQSHFAERFDCILIQLIFHLNKNLLTECHFFGTTSLNFRKL